MKRRILLMLCFFAALGGLGAASAPAEDGDDAHGDFIYRSGTELMLHGKPFRYVGTNCYYLMTYAAQPDLRKHVDRIFDDAAKMGVKVLRTWAFNDGKRQWSALQTHPGSYKEGTFVGLDYVIAQAKNRGIYLILTLGNNWNDYGGARQYIDWSPTAVKKEHNEFFTDINTKQYFKDHIKAVLTRENTITNTKYMNEPAIMAWELMNEPEVEGDPSGDILNEWIGEMSAFVKSIDKNHLVTTGCEGFYANADKYDWKMNGARGGDFPRNHSFDTVDIASFHLWPCSNKYCLTLEETVDWIKKHADDSRKIGKPLILGEYGEFRGYNGDTIERDTIFKVVLDTIKKEGVSGSNFWQLLHDDYKKYDDGCGVYYPEDSSTIEIIKSAAEKANSGE